MARMTWDSEAEAVYVYAVEDHEGPVQTGTLFTDEVTVNIDRTMDGRLIGIEIIGVDRVDWLTGTAPTPSPPAATP